MSDRTIEIRSERNAAWILLNRPPLNILNISMMRQLAEAIDAAVPRHDVLIFHGAGAKGFSAGADVGDHAPDRVAEMLKAFHGVFRRLWRSDCLAVAAVHGWCLGGGCELAMFCDFVIAAESAVFGQPEIKLGAVPPVAMVLLPRLIGPRAAWDMILTGRNVPASDAEDLGLVTRLVPEEGLARGAQSLVDELSTLSPVVRNLARNELRRRTGLDFEKELNEVETFYLEHLMHTEDAAEGIRAFLEKRSPAWSGH